MAQAGRQVDRPVASGGARGAMAPLAPALAPLAPVLAPPGPSPGPPGPTVGPPDLIPGPLGLGYPMNLTKFDESYPPSNLETLSTTPPSNFTNHPRKWEPKISNPTPPPPPNLQTPSTTPPRILPTTHESESRKSRILPPPPPPPLEFRNRIDYPPPPSNKS